MMVEMIVRTTITFVVLLVLARILGKEQVSQLTFFNYITGITIGSIAADLAGQSETPFWNGMTSLIWWTTLSVGVSFLSLKSFKWKKWLDDEPSIVIKRGKIQEEILRKKRLPVEDLMMLMRLQGVFSFQEVAFAVLETNGELSILKTTGAQSVTKKESNAIIRPVNQLPTAVLIEGKWMTDACTEIGITPMELSEQLRQNGYMHPENLFFVQWQEDGTLYVDEKSDDIES